MHAEAKHLHIAVKTTRTPPRKLFDPPWLRLRKKKRWKSAEIRLRTVGDTSDRTSTRGTDTSTSHYITIPIIAFPTPFPLSMTILCTNHAQAAWCGGPADPARQGGTSATPPRPTITGHYPRASVPSSTSTPLIDASSSSKTRHFIADNLALVGGDHHLQSRAHTPFYADNDNTHTNEYVTVIPYMSPQHLLLPTLLSPTAVRNNSQFNSRATDTATVSAQRPGGTADPPLSPPTTTCTGTHQTSTLLISLHPFPHSTALAWTALTATTVSARQRGNSIRAPPMHTANVPAHPIRSLHLSFRAVTAAPAPHRGGIPSALQAHLGSYRHRCTPLTGVSIPRCYAMTYSTPASPRTAFPSLVSPYSSTHSKPCNLLFVHPEDHILSYTTTRHHSSASIL